MEKLIAIVAVAGLLPLLAGLARCRAGSARDGLARFTLAHILLGTLAFNLTFFWQELWLCIPKALTPGLFPVLYHNDHEWTGTSPSVELLQGSGAVATAGSGMLFLALYRFAPRITPTWKAFCFWMGLQGSFQSLSQVAIGSVLPGNDVGRALAYLGVGSAASVGLLIAALLAMAASGIAFARVAPSDLGIEAAVPTRAFAAQLTLIALGVTVLCVPFRVPRNPVEVIAIPAIVNLIATAWLVLGATLTSAAPNVAQRPGRVAVAVPALALLALLVFFQAVLRNGVAL